jgi:hypothetical protein
MSYINFIVEGEPVAAATVGNLPLPRRGEKVSLRRAVSPWDAVMFRVVDVVHHWEESSFAAERAPKRLWLHDQGSVDVMLQVIGTLEE